MADPRRARKKLKLKTKSKDGVSEDLEADPEPDVIRSQADR